MNRATESGTVTRASQNTYQPALDGLRAIAVLLVVAFHTGLDHLTLDIPGG